MNALTLLIGILSVSTLLGAIVLVWVVIVLLVVEGIRLIKDGY